MNLFPVAVERGPLSRAVASQRGLGDPETAHLLYPKNQSRLWTFWTLNIKYQCDHKFQNWDVTWSYHLWSFFLITEGFLTIWVDQQEQKLAQLVTGVRPHQLDLQIAVGWRLTFESSWMFYHWMFQLFISWDIVMIYHGMLAVLSCKLNLDVSIGCFSDVQTWRFWIHNGLMSFNDGWYQSCLPVGLTPCWGESCCFTIHGKRSWWVRRCHKNSVENSTWHFLFVLFCIAKQKLVGTPYAKQLGMEWVYTKRKSHWMQVLQIDEVYGLRYATKTFGCQPATHRSRISKSWPFPGQKWPCWNQRPGWDATLGKTLWWTSTKAMMVYRCIWGYSHCGYWISIFSVE